MKQYSIAMLGLMAAIGLFAGLVLVPAISIPEVYAHCKTGSGKDFPGKGPGGNCPPGLKKKSD